MSKYVFISFTAQDLMFVQLLEEKLWNNGKIKSWHYKSKYKLPPGQSWLDSLDRIIRGAQAVILVMTPEAMASEYVTYEWAFALGANKKFVPLLHRQTELHRRLKSLQYLDFRDQENLPWDVLLNILKKDLAVPVVVDRNQQYRIVLGWDGRTSLQGFDLSERNLAGVGLQRANLFGAVLRGTNFTKADLSRANLKKCNLAEAKLNGANLFGADLTGANLEGADLSWANLSGATTDGANFKGIKDEFTKWPEQMKKQRMRAYA